MRFCDFFLSYKLNLKKISSKISFSKLPLYRQFFIILILFLSLTIVLLRFFFSEKYYYVIAIIILFTSLIIFFIIDSKEPNITYMLDTHYKTYSDQRMKMLIELLEDFNIDIKNTTSIDLIIAEAQLAQKENGFTIRHKNSIHLSEGIVLPIISIAAQKICDTFSVSELYALSIQIIIIILLLMSIIISFAPIINRLLFRDNNLYNELIYDLRQLKIFYAKKTKKHSKNK